MFPHTFVIRWGLRCRAFLRMLSILSLGCRWMLDESGSSSTKWRRDSTSLLVKVSTGFRSSTTRSDWQKGKKKAEELRHWGKIVWKKIHLRKKNVDRNGYIWMASMYSSHQTKLTANTWDTSVSDESLLAEELWLYLRAYYLVLGVLLAQRNLHLGFSVNFKTDRCLKGVKFPWSEDDGGWIQSPRLIIFPYFFPFLLLFLKFELFLVKNTGKCLWQMLLYAMHF